MTFQLIAITPPYVYKEEARHIAEALNKGFSRVHIRKPEASANEIEKLAGAIPKHLRRRLSLHDHHELAKSLGIGGIHLNSRNPSAPDGWKGVLSRSTHSIEEAREFLNENYDYIFLSPFYPSYSKPGYLPRFSFEDLNGIDKSRIVALGGISHDHIDTLESIGFGGAAMLSKAWPHRFDYGRINFGLQFITHPKPGLDMVEGARMALEGGCRWIQLRHKDADELTLMEEGKALAELCKRHDATFIIDDHVELVDAVGADGVHLGKNDMSVEEARKTLGPSYIIGATANTYEELEAATRDGADYAGVGPYRFTTTKDNLAPVLGKIGYRKIITLQSKLDRQIPIVAIGGITPNDIPGIMETGVSGIAVSGSILNATDPIEATRQTLKKIKESSYNKYL